METPNLIDGSSAISLVLTSKTFYKSPSCVQNSNPVMYNQILFLTFPSPWPSFLQVSSQWV